MATITEIAPDVFRISAFVSQINLQFNHFLIRDDEPMLFHTGLRAMFNDVSAAVSTLVTPAALKSIAFSHFESDECGSMIDWLAVAPHAVPTCSQLGDVEPLPESDVIDRSLQALREYQKGVLAEYVPYTPLTSANLSKLAALKPKTLAIMHGSSFRGDGAGALRDLDTVFKEVFGPERTDKRTQ